MGGLLAQIKQGKQLKKVGPLDTSASLPSRPKDISSQLNAMFAGIPKSVHSPEATDIHKESEVWYIFVLLCDGFNIQIEFCYFTLHIEEKASYIRPKTYKYRGFWSRQRICICICIYIYCSCNWCSWCWSCQTTKEGIHCCTNSWTKVKLPPTTLLFYKNAKFDRILLTRIYALN